MGRRRQLLMLRITVKGVAIFWKIVIANRKRNKNELQSTRNLFSFWKVRHVKLRMKVGVCATGYLAKLGTALYKISNFFGIKFRLSRLHMTLFLVHKTLSNIICLSLGLTSHQQLL